MRLITVGAALIAVGALSGCQSTPPSSVQPAAYSQKPKTVCETAAELVSNPWATYGQVAVAMEVARNHGCFGQRQPTRVDLNIHAN